MTFNFDAQTLNADYAIASESSSQRYPAIQATVYKPGSMREKIQLALAKESVDILTPEQQKLINAEHGIFALANGDDVELFTLPDTVRFSILAMPRVLGLDKKTGVVSPIQKGEKLGGNGGRVTVSRLLLAMIVDDQIVLDDDGNPQIFTLKLKSTNTTLIGNQKNPDEGTIHSLNQSVGKLLNKPNQWLTHLVSVSIEAKPVKRQSKLSSEASLATEFVLNPNAKALPKEAQKKLFEFVSTDEFKALAADPFGLNKGKDAEEFTVLGGDFDENPF